MIFYFSGTGNSRWAARQIAALTGDEAVDIVGTKQAPDLGNETQVGLVFPIYAWGAPEPVLAFAKTLRPAQEETRAQVQSLRREVEAEQLRLTAAQNATAAYVSKLKELYQHELDYLGSLSKLTSESAAPADPVEAAAEEIQATMDRIAQEEIPDPEPEEDAPEEDERPGGLYSDLTATFLDRDGETERKIKVNPERRAAEMAEAAKEPEDDEPTKRLSIDLEHLQFGKDYEIK